MLRRAFLLALTLLVSTLTTAIAQDRANDREGWTVVQPAETASDLLLWSRPGEARVEVGGEARSYSLAPGEQLTEIVETRDGWVAAGRRRAEDGSSELIVMTDREGAPRRVLSDVGSSGRVQVLPRLLVAEGRLDGVAWLEGEGARDLSVRTRSWMGADWGPVETVSRPGPGSQTGLAATELRGGKMLLVWSAFDGDDDEIQYSVGGTNGFDAPRRIGKGNRVPDVTPTVVAVRGGALAAWSRLTAEGYELVVSRYRRGKWKRPASLGPGLFPRFHRVGDRLLLVHRTAEPRGWAAVELDGRGEPRRRAGFLATAPDRPWVELRDGSGPDLNWPHRRKASGYWDVP